MSLLERHLHGTDRGIELDAERVDRCPRFLHRPIGAAQNSRDLGRGGELLDGVSGPRHRPERFLEWKLPQIFHDLLHLVLQLGELGRNGRDLALGRVGPRQRRPRAGIEVESYIELPGDQTLELQLRSQPRGDRGLHDAGDPGGRRLGIQALDPRGLHLGHDDDLAPPIAELDVGDPAQGHTAELHGRPDAQSRHAAVECHHAGGRTGEPVASGQDEDGADPADPKSYAEYKGNVYAPDLIWERARAFLRENRDRPFFLYLSYTFPHANNEEGQRTGNGMQVPDPGPYASEPWSQVEKNKAAMITRLDGHIGTLLDQLQRLKLEDNTVVIFTAD